MCDAGIYPHVMWRNLCSTLHRISVLTGSIVLWVKYNAWTPPLWRPQDPCVLRMGAKRLNKAWLTSRSTEAELAAACRPAPFNIWPMLFAWHWGNTTSVRYVSNCYMSPAAFHIKEMLPCTGRCQHTGSSARQHVSDKITGCCGSHLPSCAGGSMATLCLVKTWFGSCIILW